MLAFDDLTDKQKAEVRGRIVASLRPAAERTLNPTAPTYEGALSLIDDLVRLASTE